jgi:hypothetical protein
MEPITIQVEDTYNVLSLAKVHEKSREGLQELCIRVTVEGVRNPEEISLID